MDKDAFFWRIMAGELPLPRAAQTLGMVMRGHDPETQTVEVEFQARAEFTNLVGDVQGGFLAAMLDDAMTPAVAATLTKGQIAPTLNMNVCFERPAKVGTIVGRGRVLKKGRDVCFLAAELYQDDQRIASATATALVRLVTE
jgi:uncharacterized protein (TIGR00369 family)